MDLCSIVNNPCTREVGRARNKHKEFPPERGTFVGLQVYDRVGISQVEVYETKRNSVI